MGFKRWGFKQIPGYLRKNAFFLRFLDFPGALRPLRKRAKKAEKGEKGRFGRFPGRAATHPLSPHLLHPHLRQPKCSRPSSRSTATGDGTGESEVVGVDIRRFPKTSVKKTGEFQVTVCGVTVCPFSRHNGNQRPKCI